MSEPVVEHRVGSDATGQDQTVQGYANAATALRQLAETVDTLRAPDGCPWDAKQSHKSLVRYLIEETYEVVSAIETADDEELKEELGDLLYQIVFHAAIAGERGAFDLADVASTVAQKMVQRHPHVFDAGLAGSKDLDTVIRDWEEIKRAEKTERTSRLDGIPHMMPALLLADKLFGKVRDLPELTQRYADVEGSGAPKFQTEEELGELLFSTVYAAKAQGFDAERALRTRLSQFMDDTKTLERRSAAEQHITGDEIQEKRN